MFDALLSGTAGTTPAHPLLLAAVHLVAAEEDTIGAVIIPSLVVGLQVAAVGTAPLPITAGTETLGKNGGMDPESRLDSDSGVTGSIYPAHAT